MVMVMMKNYFKSQKKKEEKLQHIFLYPGHEVLLNFLNEKICL